MKCPIHDVAMQKWNTQFGARWQCPEPGCEMACWGGQTSTPADKQTRAARNVCHLHFDPTWADPEGSIRRKFKNRKQAYRWLRRAMRLPWEKAHIGMFTLTQCQRLMDKLKELQEAST